MSVVEGSFFNLEKVEYTQQKVKRLLSTCEWGPSSQTESLRIENTQLFYYSVSARLGFSGVLFSWVVNCIGIRQHLGSGATQRHTLQHIACFLNLEGRSFALL